MRPCLGDYIAKIPVRPLFTLVLKKKLLTFVEPLLCLFAWNEQALWNNVLQAISRQRKF